MACVDDDISWQRSVESGVCSNRPCRAYKQCVRSTSGSDVSHAVKRVRRMLTMDRCHSRAPVAPLQECGQHSTRLPPDGSKDPGSPRYPRVPRYTFCGRKTVDLLAVSHQLGPCRSYTNICAGCNLHRYPRDLMRLASSGDNTTADPSEPVPLPRAVEAKTLSWNMRSLLRASTARDLVPPPPPPPPPPRRKTRPSNTVGDLGALAHPSSCQRPAGMSRRRNRFKLSPWL